MKIVTVTREMSGTSNLGRPTVYTCEGYTVSVKISFTTDATIKVDSPEGDPDNEVLAEIIGAILKDQSL